MLDRRHMLLAGVAAMTAGNVRAAPATGQGARLTAYLDQVMQEALQLSPQLMTIAGFDTGPNAAAKQRLDDRSAAGLAQWKAIFDRMARELAKFQPETLTGIDLVNHRTGVYLAESTLRSFDFKFGDPGVGGAIPYVISQLTGNYRNIPTFLASQHTVATAADAEAYIDRLGAFAVSLDQETERVATDFARGAAPPDFVLRTTLVQFAVMLAPEPAKSELVANLVSRTAAKGLAGDWQARATKIVADQVYPAMRRQQGLLERALTTASSDAGCWRLPDGEAYYRFAVRAFTTTEMSGDEIHALGLELVAKLTAEADVLLSARGLTQGSVGQRIAALRRDPGQLYSNDDAGRAQVLSDMNGMVAAMNARLPAYFGALPRAPVEIHRTPPSIEAGAPGGTYQPPTMDGSRPGIFHINLRDMSDVAKFDIPTLVYHEVVPGHHLQNALNMEATGLPMMRRMPLFSGFSEGWALYAEQLADEMGVYRDDPLGRLGYLASFLFRAARLVVDSGLHHKRWSRQKAIRYMIDTLGEADSIAVAEVERYCVQPGQACSYMLGHEVWDRSRTEAKRVLGAGFDLKGFHDAGLLAGSVPLDVLEMHLKDWSTAQSRRSHG